MDNTTIYNELLTIKAQAELLAEAAERLRLKLQPVSTGRNQKDFFDEEIAKTIAKRHKRLKLVK